MRPELAAAVSSPIHPALLPAWALLAAHVLALPPDSHGRRLLVQTLKEAHEVVPGVLNALVPLLPLDGSGTSGSGGSGRGGGARAVQAAPSAAAGHQVGCCATKESLTLSSRVPVEYLVQLFSCLAVLFVPCWAEDGSCAGQSCLPAAQMYAYWGTNHGR